jgi:transposase
VSNFIKIYDFNMEKREAIVAALLAGKCTKVIVEECKVSEKTIYNVKRCLKEGKGLAHQSGAGRPKSVTTPRLINAIKSRVARNPVRTMRGMARDLNVSEKTVRRIVKKNLKAKSFARNQKFLLTDRIKISRLERCKKIMNQLKKKTPIILFTDEKYFTVDPITNSRTSRYIAKGRAKDVPDHVKSVQNTKHPAQIMMFGLVASNGLKMDPVYLPIGLRMGAKDYLELVLKPHVLPWIQENFDDDDNVVLMQDGAPCHTANLVQNWLRTRINFWPKDVWPPSSPDLNPLDFSIWANVQAKVNVKQHPNTEALKASINKVWADMSGDEIRTICSRFRPRVEAVIAAEGGYID